MPNEIFEKAQRACAELSAIFEHVDETGVEAVIAEIRRARRIALYGVGREGLMMKALAMRLYHLGLDAHPVGDMTTPPVGPGDLLLTSAGPGRFSTVMALLGVAREAGARIGVLTAQPAGDAAREADFFLCLPAQTMADDMAAGASRILPMGSAYEGAMYILFEILVQMLRKRAGASMEELRGRHTNLE